jgi:predicted DNA-binding protein
LSGKTWSTRLDEASEEKIKSLVEKTGLKEAEIIRRLIAIGLKNVKKPADLLEI